MITAKQARKNSNSHYLANLPIYEIEEILTQIEALRKRLNTLIQEKDTLLDPEIVVASQKLDSALNEYGKIAKRKTNN